MFYTFFRKAQFQTGEIHSNFFSEVFEMGENRKGRCIEQIIFKYGNALESQDKTYS